MKKSVYVPIKLTDLHITDFERLENTHANLILNEHWMIINTAVRLFSSISELLEKGDD